MCVNCNVPSFVRVGNVKDGIQTKEYVNAKDILGVRKNANNEWHATVKEEQIAADGKSSGPKYITVPLNEDTVKNLNLIG